MALISVILITVVASLHFVFFILESLLWQKPTGFKVFGHPNTEFAKLTAKLAMNQGWYNLFFTFALVASFFSISAFEIQMFVLVCIMVAAIVGALTVSKTILLIQGLPALLAAIFLIGSRIL